MALLELLKKRHSIRKFRDEQISQEELQQILNAAQLSPSGHNVQLNHIVAIQNPQILKDLQAKIVECFAAMETPDAKDSLYVPITRSKENKYPCMYNPPTFIIVANKRAAGNAMADSALAMENMMLMATELHIGTCWINQIRWLQDNPTMMDYLTTLGISKEEVVCASLAVGYSIVDVDKESKIFGNKVDIIK